MSSPCVVVYTCVFIASPAAALIFQFNGCRFGEEWVGVEGELHRGITTDTEGMESMHWCLVPHGA